mgnify:CR=1 FL=1
MPPFTGRLVLRFGIVVLPLGRLERQAVRDGHQQVRVQRLRHTADGVVVALEAEVLRAQEAQGQPRAGGRAALVGPAPTPVAGGGGGV